MEAGIKAINENFQLTDQNGSRSLFDGLKNNDLFLREDLIEFIELLYDPNYIQWRFITNHQINVRGELLNQDGDI